MAIRVLQPKNMLNGLIVSDDGNVATDNFITSVVKQDQKLVITKLDKTVNEIDLSEEAVGNVAFAVRLGSGSGGDALGSYGGSFTTIDYKGSSPTINDGGGTWSDNTYTVPSDGLYLINTSIRTTDGTQSGVNVFQCVDVDNRDRPEGIWQTTNGKRFTFQYSRIMRLNKDDVLRHYIYCDGATITLSGAKFEVLKLS